MRTFAEKQNQPQQKSAAILTRPNTLAPAASREAHPLLDLQRSIGNQGVLRLLKARADGLEAGSDTEVNSETQATLPTLAVNTPGDVYEQEADRISEQVMRMPEPQLPRDCACGGGCPKCLKEQQPQKPARLQTKRVGSSDSGQTTAAPIGHDALASPGQPLDASTREFFEPRFGHDFSRVRVHFDATAEQSAQDLNANAYTAGHDIVFGAGRFAPGTHEGRSLIAHELTHIVQQSGGVQAIQRQPASSERDERAARQRAQRLARRIKIHTKVSKEVRALIEHDMAFYKDGAREAYIRELEPALRAVHEPELIGKNRFSPVTSLSLIRQEDFCGGQKCLSDEDLQMTEESKGPQAYSDLAPSLIPRKGSKDLKKGRMEWTLQAPGSEGKGSSARIQITFTAKPSYRSQTVTFLQTVLSTKEDTVATPSQQTNVDLRPDIEETDPFYGADWDPGKNAWEAESVKTPVPEGFKNSPSSGTDASAYLFDQPVVYPGMARVFESVAVIPETGEVLGSLKWGLSKDTLLGAQTEDCTDLPSAGFGATMSKFYSVPQGEAGYDVYGRFETILEGYAAGDFDLGTENQKQLDPVISKFVASPKMQIAVSGFADTSEEDPSFVSEMRALIVKRYLMSKGVPEGSIDVLTFGSAWARYPSSPTETRNRRVQIRTYYK